MLCTVPVYNGNSFPIFFFLLLIGKDGMQTYGRLISVSLLLPVVEQTSSVGIYGQGESKKCADLSLKIKDSLKID